MSDPICPDCGGFRETCGVCGKPIEGQCRGSDDPCEDGGHYNRVRAFYTHGDYCLRDGDRELIADDNAERVRDMNAELRGGRFYR